MKAKAKSQDPAPYSIHLPDAVDQAVACLTEDQILAKAIQICESRFKANREVFDSPDLVRAYLRFRLDHANADNYEVFGVMFLDSQHGLIESQEMFRGTLNNTSVYPREVAKLSLRLGAAAVVLYHNHPSGDPTPSSADEKLTNTLKQTLALVDVRVLDHMVVGRSSVVSMAERGLV